MTQCLLSGHSVAADAGRPVTPEHMRQMMEQVYALRAEMKAAGAWVFGGRLTEPVTATVVRRSGNEVMTTDGPFVEAREHLVDDGTRERKEWDAGTRFDFENPEYRS